jgi:uncharacterized protein with PIN domain
LRIKLDENLPERLISELRLLGHDIDTVRAEHLTGRDDNEVWHAAQSADRFLITQDLDFSDVRRFAPGTHAGLLVVRLTRPGRDPLVARVTALFATEPIWEWRSSLIVVTDHKLRIRRPA